MVASLSALILPFDAHNHVHMGSNTPSLALESMSGMAVMATHPRDFPIVLDLARKEEEKIVIPCLGVHPWFLHELTDDDWRETQPGSSVPQWIFNLEGLLLSSTDSMPVIGEIGLDNFHFDPISKELTSDMETQVRALELQLSLATKHQLPVSMHCVRAMGKLMDTLSKTKQSHSGQLPPRIYFHAFGGKAATVDQLVKTLETKHKKTKKKKSTNDIVETKVYFGFAPLINFESKKTLEVIQAVGLERLVLETDHEEAARVTSSMATGLKVISQILGVSPEELIRQTNLNAQDLYSPCWPNNK